jgi:8-oxo-dGTP pyrophosphatase MutT (NUDIX family)
MIIRASAGGVVVGEGGKIVLVEQHSNTWSLPKGGIEEGESTLEAAVREIREETGLSNLTLLCELGTYVRYSINKEGTGELKNLGLRPRTMFLFKTNDTELLAQDSEVTQVRFVTYDEALSLLTHPKDKEFLHSVRGTVEAWLQ